MHWWQRYMWWHLAATAPVGGQMKPHARIIGKQSGKTVVLRTCASMTPASNWKMLPGQKVLSSHVFSDSITQHVYPSTVFWDTAVNGTTQRKIIVVIPQSFQRNLVYKEIKDSGHALARRATNLICCFEDSQKKTPCSLPVCKPMPSQIVWFWSLKAPRVPKKTSVFTQNHANLHFNNTFNNIHLSSIFHIFLVCMT